MLAGEVHGQGRQDAALEAGVGQGPWAHVSHGRLWPPGVPMGEGGSLTCDDGVHALVQKGHGGCAGGGRAEGEDWEAEAEAGLVAPHAPVTWVRGSPRGTLASLSNRRR